MQYADIVLLNTSTVNVTEMLHKKDFPEIESIYYEKYWTRNKQS